jgi:hypothetical protein
LTGAPAPCRTTAGPRSTRQATASTTWRCRNDFEI